MKPSVGRIVHAYVLDNIPYAAIITEVDGDEVISLSVFVPESGPPQHTDKMSYSETPKQGCWTWPPRV